MENYIGKRLSGRYELLKLIGSGGMANVFEAKDLLEDKIVAIKVLKEEYLTNDVFVMGDHRNASKDSRMDEVGLINVKDIAGKAIFRIWPLNKIGGLE